MKLTVFSPFHVFSARHPVYHNREFLWLFHCLAVQTYTCTLPHDSTVKQFCGCWTEVGTDTCNLSYELFLTTFHPVLPLPIFSTSAAFGYLNVIYAVMRTVQHWSTNQYCNSSIYNTLLCCGCIKVWKLIVAYCPKNFQSDALHLSVVCWIQRRWLFLPSSTSVITSRESSNVYFYLLFFFFPVAMMWFGVWGFSTEAVLLFQLQYGFLWYQ